MTYKIKSLIYFLVFIAAAIMYHNLEQQKTEIASAAPVALLDNEVNTNLGQDLMTLQELQ